MINGQRFKNVYSKLAVNLQWGCNLRRAIMIEKENEYTPTSETVGGNSNIWGYNWSNGLELEWGKFRCHLYMTHFEAITVGIYSLRRFEELKYHWNLEHSCGQLFEGGLLLNSIKESQTLDTRLYTLYGEGEEGTDHLFITSDISQHIWSVFSQLMDFQITFQSMPVMWRLSKICIQQCTNTREINRYLLFNMQCAGVVGGKEPIAFSRDVTFTLGIFTYMLCISFEIGHFILSLSPECWRCLFFFLLIWEGEDPLLPSVLIVLPLFISIKLGVKKTWI